MVQKIFKLNISIWGKPPKRIYRFLHLVEKTGLPKTLCILGCADGKEVLPAARMGFKVAAIDSDKTAIHGGIVKIAGKDIKVDGLVSRLRKEHLENRVEVVEADYISYKPKHAYSGVFTSGTIHYQQNIKTPLKIIIKKIQSYLSVGGIACIEYIHQSEMANNPKRNYLTSKQLNSFFNKPEWSRISHKVKTYTEDPNPRNPQIHKIAWGRLYVMKNKVVN
jgi:hypothetical protein